MPERTKIQPQDPYAYELGLLSRMAETWELNAAVIFDVLVRNLTEHLDITFIMEKSKPSMYLEGKPRTVGKPPHAFTVWFENDPENGMIVCYSPQA